MFAWMIVLLTGAWCELSEIDGKTMLFLCFSGIATGASWLCYFRALQVGDINKVVPVDKSSTVLTILLALVFLHEGLSLGKAAAVSGMTAGILLMIEKKDTANPEDAKKAGFYMLLALLFCKSYGYFREDRDFRCGFKSGNSNPNNSCSGNGMGHGFRKWKGSNDSGYFQKGISVYLLFRNCNGSIVALLLSGPQ